MIRTWGAKNWVIRKPCEGRGEGTEFQKWKQSQVHRWRRAHHAPPQSDSEQPTRYQLTAVSDQRTRLDQPLRRIWKGKRKKPQQHEWRGRSHDQWHSKQRRGAWWMHTLLHSLQSSYCNSFFLCSSKLFDQISPLSRIRMLFPYLKRKSQPKSNRKSNLSCRDVKS